MPLDAVPQDWMPAAQMERIHVHWTAGGHSANATDRSRYHVLIEGDGSLVRGDRSIAANARGSGMTPASHTLRANAGAIGVSMCCMARAVERPFSAGPSPMTQAQWSRALEVVAQLARRYAIPVTPVTILTHSEVEPNLRIPQRQKWDINNLAFDASVTGPAGVGALMRRRVAALLGGGGGQPQRPPPEMRLPRFRVAGVAPDILVFRDAPNGNKKGELPEGTLVERLGIDGHWWRVRTPGGFVGWVFSSFLRASTP